MPITFTEEDFKSEPLTFSESDFAEPAPSEPLTLERPEPLIPRTGPQSTISGGPKLSLPEGAALSVKNEVMEELTNPLVTVPKFKINETDSRTMTVGKEAANIALSIPEFFTSKLGVGAAISGLAAPTITAAAFTVDMLDSLGKQITSAYENWDQMTTNQKYAAMTDVGGTMLMAGLTGRATARGLEPPAVKLARELDRPQFDPIAEERAAFGGISHADFLKAQDSYAPMTAKALFEQARLSAPEAIRVSEEPKATIETTTTEKGPENVYQTAEPKPVTSSETRNESPPSEPAPAEAGPDTEFHGRTTEGVQETPGSGEQVEPQPKEISETETQEAPKVETEASQPPKVDGGTTAIKNAMVERDREAMGLPKFEEPARQDYGSAWDDAMRQVNENPAVQDNLIASLKANPRALQNATESALLHHRLVELKNEYNKSTRALAEAYDQARTEDIPAINDMVQAWSDKIKELTDITKKVGTEWGRTGAARKMIAADDFSLLGLELQKRADNGGRKLTSEERAQLAKVAADFKEKSDKLETHIQEHETRTTTNAVDEQINTLKKHSQEAQSLADKIVNALDKQANAARERLKGKLFNLPAALPDLVIIGAAEIAKAPITFAQWSTKMLGEFGEKIKPHLDEIWDKAHDLLDKRVSATIGVTNEAKASAKSRVKGTPDTVESITEKIKSKVVDEAGADIGGLAQKLARHFVEQGVTEREALIDAVHEVLEPLIPDHTRLDTMNAISGYGKFKQLSKDEINKKLRDLKGQMQQLGKLEDMSKGEAPKKTGIERREPTDEERRLIAKVNEEKKKGGFTVTDPATQLKSAIQSLKTRWTHEISDLERKLAEGDYTKKDRSSIPLDTDGNKIRAELQLVKNQWNESRAKDQLANRSTMANIRDEALRAIASPRALLSSMDLSAVLRQGGFITLGHPVRASRSIGPMLKAFASERSALENEAEIHNRPNAPVYERSGLYLAPLENRVKMHEEAFLPSWAEKVPGVRHSERAYVTFLNKLRADSFDTMVSSLTKRGTPLSEAELKAIANYINVATGRGNLVKHAAAAETFAVFFFSPRLVTSRFQLLLGQPLIGGTMRTRRLVAGEYARTLAGLSVVYGLGMMAGATVETDSNSPDFGKLKFGNTRVDPMMGLSQATVLMSRFGSGKTKSAKGKEHNISGKVPYGKSDVVSVLANFARSKLAPVPGAVIDARRGTTITGDTVTPASLAANLVTPMVAKPRGGDWVPFGEVVDRMKELGITKATAIEMLDILGMSVQTFDENAKKK